MKLGTGSNTERTQKYARVKVQYDIRTSKYINKEISPIFNCVTPESVSLANKCMYGWYVCPLNAHAGNFFL